MADTLYAELTAAVREGAPHHLFLGERFQLRSASDPVLRAVGRHGDVFCTQALIRSAQRPPEWQVFQAEAFDREHALTGKPMLIIDWAAPFSLGSAFTSEHGDVRSEPDATEDAAAWLKAALGLPYIIGIFKCQLLGLHKNDRWFNDRARRTYLRDDGTSFATRTTRTRAAHAEGLALAYAAAGAP